MQFHCLKRSKYFPKSFEPFGRDINVKVDLSNYATKTDIENISHIVTSHFSLKSNLASLKTEVDKLDIDKLLLVPINLSKLSDVKNDVKKTVFDKLVVKVNSIDTSRFALKTNYDTDKKELENKIPVLVVFLKREITMLKSLKLGKIPSISDLTTNAALTTVENKIPNINSLVKKNRL